MKNKKLGLALFSTMLAFLQWDLSTWWVLLPNYVKADFQLTDTVANRC